jgi:hypothetical protein
MIIGAVVAVVVVAIAAFLLLHKGSSNSSSAGVVPKGTINTQPSAPNTVSHGKAGGKSHGGLQTLPMRAKRAVVRDPFKPLVVAPVAGSTQQGPTTTVSPPPAAPSTSLGSGTTTQPTSAPVVIPSQPTTTTSTPAGQPIWIRLVSTNGDRSATFDVGYPHHKFHRFKVLAPSPTSAQGTVFDKVFALLGIQNGEVTLQIGDATPFDLTRGVSHSV